MAEGYTVQNTVVTNHKRVLRKKALFLLETISDVQGISTRLLMENVISAIKYRDIEDTLKNKTQTDAIRLMLKGMETVSSDDYNTFKKILRESGMESIVEELEEEEASLAPLDEEENIPSSEEEDTGLDVSVVDGMNNLILEVPIVEEGHYDICILCEDSDTEVAQEVKRYLETLDSEAESPVKIFLHDDENVVHMKSKTGKLRKIARVSTLQFYIVPPSHEEGDADIQWLTDSLILKDMESDGKLTVKVVLIDATRTRGIDPALANLQKIKWYENHKDYFKSKMKFLIDKLKTSPKRSQS